MRKFLLITLPNCRPCYAMKEHLDKIELSDGLKFEYSVIDVSQNDELVKEYDIQTVPTFISPKGSKLLGNPGRVKVTDWIIEQLS